MIDRPSRPKVTIHEHGKPPRPPAPAPAAPAIGANSGVKTMTVTDAQGRQITIKKLGPLDNWRLMKLLGPEHSKHDGMYSYAMLVMAITAIDGQPEAPPSTMLQLEHMIGRLDEDGLSAVGLGYREFFTAQDATEFDPDTIKNSPATAPSASV